MKDIPTAQQWASDVRAEMARRRITARWLAKELGVSYTTINRWLNGGCKEVDSMLRVNAVLNLE
jgi:transcriptional regulator with XRE-family HTH domain